jgi:membrane associated rhomboid family serine protease
MARKDSRKPRPGTVKSSAFWMFCFVSLIWAVEAVNALTGHALNDYGILPRTSEGAVGILTAPLLHVNPRHALANTVPFIILGWLVAAHGRRPFLTVTLIVWLLSGAGVWLIGRPQPHVGASGLVFGYFAFLLAMAWYERSARSILIAVVSVLLYGGLIWCLAPRGGLVSWESHACGFLAGVLAAYLVARRSRPLRERV